MQRRKDVLARYSFVEPPEPLTSRILGMIDRPKEDSGIDLRDEMKADRYKIVTIHGEGETIYSIVDTAAPEGEQPAVVRSESTKYRNASARSCMEIECERLNGRGYRP